MEVWWEDHCSFSNGGGWVYHENTEDFVKGPPSLFRTIGYVVRDDEDIICLTDTLGSAETATVHKILKKDVVRRRVITG